MIQYFTRLFRYDKWANENVIKSITENDIHDDYCNNLMSHILNVEHIWWDRIDHGESDVDRFQVRKMDNWQDNLYMINDKYRNLLKTVDEIELDRKRKYVNFKGTTYHIALRDILGHVINHSTHHRGQIAHQLRELNFEPPVTDYIYYLYQL